MRSRKQSAQITFPCAVLLLFWAVSTLSGTTLPEDFRWGVIAFNNGLYDKAVLSLEKAIGEDPDHPLIHEWLGRSYYAGGYEGLALKEWQGLIDREEARGSLINLYNLVKERRAALPYPFETQKWVALKTIKGSLGNVLFFQNPTAIVSANDGSGASYVVSFNTGEVVKLSVDGRPLDRFDGGLEGYDHPFHLLPLPQGRFLLSEYEADRVVLCDKKGRRTATFGTRGTGNGELLGPQFLASEGEEYFYVTDWGNKRVVKYDLKTEEAILSFGEKKGEFPGFAGPSGIALGRGTVYVADSLKKRIDLFDQSGNYLAPLLKTGLARPEGLSLQGESLYIADGNAVRVYHLKQDTLETLFTQTPPARLMSVGFDENRILLVADYQGDAVSLLSGVETLYSGLFITIDRINALAFPRVTMEVTVQDREKNPIVGLSTRHFVVTEGSASTKKMTLAYAGSLSPSVHAIFLLDLDRHLYKDRRKSYEAIESLAGELTAKGDSWSIMTVGKRPTLRGQGDLSVLETIGKDEWTSSSDLTAGIRLAASQLIPGHEKRVVFLFTTGDAPSRKALARYDLLDLARYLDNNDVAFYPILLASGQQNEAWEYLSSETGGREISLDRPAGVKDLIDPLRRRKSGKYIMTYESKHPADFGRAYIPTEVQVTLIQESGRDELGYFSPLSYERRRH